MLQLEPLTLFSLAAIIECLVLYLTLSLQAYDRELAKIKCHMLAMSSRITELEDESDREFAEAADG